jgi:hypothetical protein
MTFKKTTRSEWKMIHENHTAYIGTHLNSYCPRYYLSIVVETFDGQYYETKNLLNEEEFDKLNEAKRFAKDYINSNN